MYRRLRAIDLMNKTIIEHSSTAEMRNTAPAVSVVIPAYNEMEGIATVVTNIRQTMDRLDRSYEIIVVDDGSQDATADRARQASAQVISHPYNIGNGAAVKTGIRNARGKALESLSPDPGTLHPRTGPATEASSGKPAWWSAERERGPLRL